MSLPLFALLRLSQDAFGPTTSYLLYAHANVATEDGDDESEDELIFRKLPKKKIGPPPPVDVASALVVKVLFFFFIFEFEAFGRLGVNFCPLCFIIFLLLSKTRNPSLSISYSVQ